VIEEWAYILVHQTRLANTAVAQDDDLWMAVSLPSCSFHDRVSGAYLEQDLLPGSHCASKLWEAGVRGTSYTT
jgi:hypothetical protein